MPTRILPSTEILARQILTRIGYSVVIASVSTLRGGTLYYGSFDYQGKRFTERFVSIRRSPDNTFEVQAGDVWNPQSYTMVVRDDGSFDLLVAHADGPPRG